MSGEHSRFHSLSNKKHPGTSRNTSEKKKTQSTYPSNSKVSVENNSIFSFAAQNDDRYATLRYRFLNLFRNMENKEVQVCMADGSVYRGTLFSFSIFEPNEFFFTLKKVTLTDNNQQTSSQTITLNGENMVQLLATGISNQERTKNLVSDKEISGDSSKDLLNRPLEELESSWFVGAPHMNEILTDFDEHSRGKDVRWDQFETNKKLFNVDATFDETIYTTKLDVNKLTKEQIEVASKIAAEIEGKSLTDSYSSDKRIKVHNDAGSEDGSDEENLFSGVSRTVTAVNETIRIETNVQSTLNSNEDRIHQQLIQTDNSNGIEKVQSVSSNQSETSTTPQNINNDSTENLNEPQKKLNFKLNPRAIEFVPKNSITVPQAAETNQSQILPDHTNDRSRYSGNNDSKRFDKKPYQPRPSQRNFSTSYAPYSQHENIYSHHHHPPPPPYYPPYYLPLDQPLDMPLMVVEQPNYYQDGLVQAYPAPPMNSQMQPIYPVSIHPNAQMPHVYPPPSTPQQIPYPQSFPQKKFPNQNSYSGKSSRGGR